RFVSSFLQRPPDDLLGLAEAVHLGGVDEVDAEVEGAVHDVTGRVRGVIRAVGPLAGAELPAAEPHGGKLDVTDLDLSHEHRLTLRGVRVAITGSHGFIGSALSSSLDADGHAVVPISRDEVGAA